MNNTKVVNCWELRPDSAQNVKSFYGKAYVKEWSNGCQVLYSYDTPVAFMDALGNFHRLWSDWSLTTGRHVAAFCGRVYNKKIWNSYPVESQLAVLTA